MKLHNICECFFSRFLCDIERGIITTKEELEKKMEPWVNAKKAGMM